MMKAVNNEFYCGACGVLNSPLLNYFTKYIAISSIIYIVHKISKVKIKLLGSAPNSIYQFLLAK
jgi:hypothetical protein